MRQIRIPVIILMVAGSLFAGRLEAAEQRNFAARYNIDGHFAWVPSNARRNMPDWLDPKAPLLPRMLQTADYATGHYGKCHLEDVDSDVER